MTRTTAVRLAAVWMALAASELGGAPRLFAQAAVPPRGEGTVTVIYQNYYHIGHFNPAGKKTRNTATHSKAVIAEIDYAVTDTFAVTVSLPFVAAKYTGPRPLYFVNGVPARPGPLDDGTYHGAFQDLRVEARRRFAMGLFDVAPFAGVAFPTHDYETAGEAVPGRHRRELQLGMAAGASLGPILRGTYVQARYGYAALERIHDFPHTRSNIDLEIDQDLIGRVGLRGVASWQVAHKAPTFGQLLTDWENHDRLVNSSYTNVGGGASVSVTRSADLSAMWVVTVAGRSGAHVSRTLALGASWRFGSGLKGLGAPD